MAFIVPSSLAFIGNLSGPDLIIIAALGLLLFGKRLPEVGKSLGQAIVGFKKGLKETGEEVKRGAGPLTEEPEAEAPQKPAPSVKASTVVREKKALGPASEEP